MPIYEYQCESCGDIVEHWQRMSDPPLETCESCGGKMHKLISQSSFHLKGTGWYVTDYGGNRKGSSGDNKSGESKSDSKSKNSASESSTTD